MTQKNITNGKDWTSKMSGPLTAEVECLSWDGFLNFLHDEDALSLSDSFCFRGHANENWQLIPTLKRALELYSVGNVSRLEKDILNNFKNYCLGRRGHNPKQMTESEWWALGQQFGLKTPLVNWTESAYVAAYFAFNAPRHETENVAIWMLAKNINTYPEVERLAKQHHLEFLRPYIDENANMLNQRGLYIRTPEMMCVSQWIAQFQHSQSIAFAKILIPASEKKRALNSLDKMNINHLTLFLDLNGASEYANYRLTERLNFTYTPVIAKTVVSEQHERIV